MLCYMYFYLIRSSRKGVDLTTTRRTTYIIIRYFSQVPGHQKGVLLLEKSGLLSHVFHVHVGACLRLYSGTVTGLT